MDLDEFWSLVESGRSGDQPLHVSVANDLALRSEAEIMSFEHCFEALRTAVFRWDVWAAAYLIADGCSDDSFSDFTAGVVGLGREWYERVAAGPDVLANHPEVRAVVGSTHRYPVFDEEFGFVACRAYEQKTGDDKAFWEALHTADRERSGGRTEMGEDFDFDDPEQMRQRLPRLAALFLKEDET